MYYRIYNGFDFLNQHPQITQNRLKKSSLQFGCRPVLSFAFFEYHDENSKFVVNKKKTQVTSLSLY